MSAQPTVASGVLEQIVAARSRTLWRHSAALSAAGAEDALSHVRLGTGHALDRSRFDAIIDWITDAAAAAGHAS